jgi:hypothetical protein
MRNLSTWTRATIALCCLGLSRPALAVDTKDRVVNLVPFDISNCYPHALELTKPTNVFAVQAAFASARSSLQECLTDTRTYDGTKPIHGKVNITVDSSGAKVNASGEGLQPAAKACIEKAVTTQLGTVTPLAADAKPIIFDGPYERGANTGVRLGVNEASDVQGTIRLTLPQWCSCLDDYKTKVPPVVSGPITLTRKDMLQYADRFKLADGGIPKLRLVSAGLAGPPGDATAEKVATCLNAKVETLPLTSTSEQYIAPVQLFLLNSNATDSMGSSLPPPVQFAQLDASREQRRAEAFAALAKRQKAADDYDKSVVRYQTGIKSTDPKKRKAASGMLNELKSGCAALVKADEDFTAALGTQIAVEQKAVELARTLKASDPSWTDAEAAATGAAGDTQKQIDEARQATTANQKSCPKTKY